MSERRAHLRMDDGSEIELRWEPGAKFVLTVDDRSSPDVPASTPPDAGVTSVLEQRVASSGEGITP